MRTWTGRAVAAMAGLVMLSGCLPGIGIGKGQRPPGPDDPVRDPVNERWYTPSDLIDGTEKIREQFPDLEVESGMSLAGTFTEPDDRELIPAQDDYWRQSVMVVGEEAVAELVAASRVAAASDGGGDDPLAGEGTSPMNSPAGTRADDEVIRGVIVQHLEDEAGQCPDGWILLGMTLTADPTDTIRPVTADGLVITMAAVCEGGDRIVVDARDF